MKVPIIREASLPCPLVRVKGFTKPTRPAAWKGFDLKVESTLPLLAVDQSELDREMLSSPEQYEKTWALVKVQLLLKSRKSEGGGTGAKCVGTPQDGTQSDVRDNNGANGNKGANGSNGNQLALSDNHSIHSYEVLLGGSPKRNGNTSHASTPDKMEGLVLGLLVGDMGSTPEKNFKF
mmetsp:Transcript_11678/g.21069  ORF Transcript_11678/g.21069 Transcript_11678/m.21069 type:complete len:178 (-) Transcript_11678:100-633(-)